MLNLFGGEKKKLDHYNFACSAFSLYGGGMITLPTATLFCSFYYFLFHYPFCVIFFYYFFQSDFHIYYIFANHPKILFVTHFPYGLSILQRSTFQSLQKYLYKFSIYFLEKKKLKEITVPLLCFAFLVSISVFVLFPLSLFLFSLSLSLPFSLSHFKLFSSTFCSLPSVSFDFFLSLCLFFPFLSFPFSLSLTLFFSHSLSISLTLSPLSFSSFSSPPLFFYGR